MNYCIGDTTSNRDNFQQQHQGAYSTPIPFQWRRRRDCILLGSRGEEALSVGRERNGEVLGVDPKFQFRFPRTKAQNRAASGASARLLHII